VFDLADYNFLRDVVTSSMYMYNLKIEVTASHPTSFLTFMLTMRKGVRKFSIVVLLQCYEYLDIKMQ
jgi:hypothetical protein